MNNFKNQIQSGFVFLLTCSFFITSYAAFEKQLGDFNYLFSGTLIEESFAGKNQALLNNNNEGNKIWFARHTLDLNLDVKYGQQTYDQDVLKAYATVRDRGIWGNPESIASTTEADTKVVDSVARRHKHAIPLHIFWLRQVWMDFSLNAILGLPFCFEHRFKFGIFPFQLGRGISLGDAYATGPEILGFFREDVVNQYAPGGLLHGELLPNQLTYDLYAGILRNRMSSLSETGAAIFGQEYGRLLNPQRGSGSVNFVIASKASWTPFNNASLGKLVVEPYALYNRDPEQRIEFRADALGQLGTIGLAAEYTYPRFELGFDYAFNLGQQRVRGWDRNQVKEENRNGFVVLVNSHVQDQSGQKIPYIKGSKAQEIIDCAFRDESQNSQVIGTVDSVGYLEDETTLKNSATRFRDPYTNKYEGWMFVMDCAYNALQHDLKIAATAGIATGDDNPNEQTRDGVYSGFIPLQDIYSGKRVRSAFVLGGAGKLRRPLSVPVNPQSPNRFASNVNGFTNLVFVGSGLAWAPSNWPKKFSINPNIWAYWQEKPTKKFDAETNQQLDCPANTFLGTELNVFMEYYVLKDLKLAMVASFFIPGRHYKEVKGLPLSAEQKARLDRLDRTGFDADRIPNLGDDIAYTFNLALTFKF